MKQKLITILIIFTSVFVFGQDKATTTDGKTVLLYDDGTWQFVAEVDTFRPVSSVFVGGKKLTAGEKTVVHTEEYGLTTSISIAKESEKTLIIFWQETTEDKMNFFNELWTGTVVMYLENGETISLMDRNKKGQNKITNGHTSSYGSKSNLYQRFSAYYLTPNERLNLKQNNLSQIAYRTTSSFEEGTTYLEITENGDTIKEQLLAIKR